MSKITGSGAGGIPVQRSGVDKSIRERFEGTRSQVVDTRQGVGEQDVTWRGEDDAGRPVSSGAYYVRLESDSGTAIQRMTLLK